MLIFLVYHQIQDHGEGDFYSVSPTGFLAQLSMARQSDLPILNPDALLDSRRQLESGVVFTFDDGTVDHFQVVRPMLMEFGIRALFYVSTAKLDRGKYLTSEQVGTLWEDGHTIGSHSHTHKRLDVLPREQIREELELSAIAIQRLVGQRPVHFAPPGGFYNRTVQKVAQQAGYSFCRTIDWGYNRLFDPMRIEVVPMIGTLGFCFLNYALHGRSEWTLKFVCRLKNELRTFLSKSSYNQLRDRIERFSSRI